MTEMLFVLTTIFVAYVVYVIINDQKTLAKPIEQDTQSEKKIVKEQAKAEVLAKEELPTATVDKAPVTAAIASTGKGGIRDPKTGELAAVTNNYRFTKRWIKEALVAEGLLDKIYKNNELDATAEAAIKEALLKLETMDKYRA